MALVEERLARNKGLFVLGISGSQGSGKSTLAKALLAALRGQGFASETLSIDDLYLPRTSRQHLAKEVHPLLSTRGVPGTHDVWLGMSLIEDMERGEPVMLPRFDKARDERAQPGVWTFVPGNCRVLIFEGWCVGAAPQPERMLTAPVNDLERLEDPDGTWRRFVNAQLAGDYCRMFARIDAQVFLSAPDFSVVSGWRAQQERDIAGQGSAVMDEAGIARFVQFYQRITEWMIEDMPARADLVARLGRNREVLSIT